MLWLWILQGALPAFAFSDADLVILGRTVKSLHRSITNQCISSAKVTPSVCVAQSNQAAPRPVRPLLILRMAYVPVIFRNRDAPLEVDVVKRRTRQVARFSFPCDAFRGLRLDFAAVNPKTSSSTQSSAATTFAEELKKRLPRPGVPGRPVIGGITAFAFFVGLSLVSADERATLARRLLGDKGVGGAAVMEDCAGRSRDNRDETMSEGDRDPVGDLPGWEERGVSNCLGSDRILSLLDTPNAVAPSAWNTGWTTTDLSPCLYLWVSRRPGSCFRPAKSASPNLAV